MQTFRQYRTSLTSTEIFIHFATSLIVATSLKCNVSYIAIPRLSRSPFSCSPRSRDSVARSHFQMSTCVQVCAIPSDGIKLFEINTIHPYTASVDKSKLVGKKKQNNNNNNNNCTKCSEHLGMHHLPLLTKRFLNPGMIPDNWLLRGIKPEYHILLPFKVTNETKLVESSVVGAG